MAILQLENGTILSDIEKISAELAPLNIRLNSWPVSNTPQSQILLAQLALTEEQKEQLLQTLDHYFEQLKQTENYQSRDLIVLHPDTPNLDTMLSKFDKCHTHADDEVRYIIDGEGVFGFVRPDGSQIELTVQAEEYINVPAGTEHWFYLTSTKRIKAVRYFIGTEGWTPEYTGTQIKMSRLATV